MPQNGADSAPTASPPQAPGAPSATPVAKPAEPDRAQALESRLAAIEAERTAERKQWQAQQAEWTKKDKAREALEQERTRNPAKHMKELFGENWYDAATKAKAGTVAPEHVSAALDEREQRIRESVSSEVKSLRDELAELRKDREERAREKIYSQAAAHVRGNAEKYPLTTRYQKADEVGALIESHFKATARQNADGSWAPGEMWTHEQAAAEMEKYWGSIREMVLKSENGRQLPEGSTMPRLTIIPEQRAPEPPKDDAERRARVDRMWADVQAKRQGSRPN